ncbi:unnamed protein product [Brassica napus]|uniref:(rape) hypothetical protein n=1 Tax=Brassica napus TaxID=3708 RepID=A0A816TDN0_BRANA|nr:unnamed protein product [Brassica napus]
MKRCSKLMGVDMLLIDEQSTLMEGSVSVNLLSIFIERLSEGSVYTMCEFKVTQSNNSFRFKYLKYITYSQLISAMYELIKTKFNYRQDRIMDFHLTYPEESPVGTSYCLNICFSLNENGEKAHMAQLHVKKHSSPLNFLLLLCLPFIFLSDKALATLIYFLLNPIQRWMF